jgi:hypothetical protein
MFILEKDKCRLEVVLFIFNLIYFSLKIHFCFHFISNVWHKKHHQQQEQEHCFVALFRVRMIIYGAYC